MTVIILLSWIGCLAAQQIKEKDVATIARKRRLKQDDIFLEMHVFMRLSHFAPCSRLCFMDEWAFAENEMNCVFADTDLYMY